MQRHQCAIHGELLDAGKQLRTGRWCTLPDCWRGAVGVAAARLLASRLLLIGSRGLLTWCIRLLLSLLLCKELQGSGGCFLQQCRSCHQVFLRT